MVLRNETRSMVICGQVGEARSFWAKFRGLMGRASLDADEGLWFPGTTSIHMFFMRFAVDCLFLSAPDATGRRRVVSVRRSLPPWTGIVMPVRGADGLVELAAGVLARTGTDVGDEVSLAVPRDAPDATHR
jgi:uncharacterized membrane protein (UPF0127 family)